jgi:hypothetical protein
MVIVQRPSAVAVVQQDACVTGRGLVGRPLPAKKGRKRLLCPTCRTECAVKGGRAAELPIVYLALQGA